MFRVKVTEKFYLHTLLIKQTDRQTHLLIKFIVVWSQPLVICHSFRQECWQTVKKWLTTCQKWWTTCLQTVKKWWLIDIQSILPIDYRKNQYNRTIIGLSKTSNEFHVQREHRDRQTNRRQRCFLYIIKKIYLYTKNDLI